MRRSLPGLLAAALLLVPAAALRAQAPAAETAAPSPRFALDGRWDLLVDKEQAGVARGLPTGTGPAWEHAAKVVVPGPFESQSQAAGVDGVVWYRCLLPATPTPAGGRLWLVFEAADWRAEVFVDGTSLGQHDGPGEFRFDLSGRLDAAGHALVVRVVDPGDKKVDGLLIGALPSGRQSWFYNVGGLLGHVGLLPTGPVELLRQDARVLPDASVQLRVDVASYDAAPRELVLHATLADAAGELRATVPPGETTLLVPLTGTTALPHWSPDHPTLLPVAVTAQDPAGASLARLDGVAGLRRFAAAGASFTLDGQPLVLHGVGYPPYFPHGLTHPTEADFLRRDLLAVKAAGFNLVRVEQAIAPEVWSLCDELGLLVQAEPPLGCITYDLPITAPAVDATLVATAQAVQGHPSVVLLSLLDEGGGLLWRRADALLSRAQQLMPERLLLSDGGGATGAPRLANPHEPAPVPYVDVHLPTRGTWDCSQASALDTLGADGRLVYVSRWSAGGLPSFVDNVAGFNNALSSDDALVEVQRLQDETAQLAGTPLAQLIADLSSLTALGQAEQARTIRAEASVLRSRKNLAGECYADWRDVGWRDGDGLCTVWSHPKPALAALRQTDAPPPALGELQPRKVLTIAAGSLVGLSPALLDVIDQNVLRPDDPAAAGLPRIAVVGGRRPIDWSAANVGVTLSLLRFARDGGTLLLLDPPDAGRALPGDTGLEGAGQVSSLPVDVACRPLASVEGGSLLVFADHGLLLSDLELDPPVLDDRFESVAPDRVLYAPPYNGLRVELGCVDTYGRYVGAAVQSVPYGKGSLVLSTLHFDDDNVADPAVTRLLRNVVRLAASLASHRPAPPPTDSAVPADALRDSIQQHVRQYALWFGLSERMATAHLAGLRPEPRSDPTDLATMIARKNAGLDLAVQGKAAEGDKILALIADKPLGGDRELFLRDEASLADAVRASPRPPAERLELRSEHARALRLLRLGEIKAALSTLDQALAGAKDKPPAPAAASPLGTAASPSGTAEAPSATAATAPGATSGVAAPRP